VTQDAESAISTATQADLVIATIDPESVAHAGLAVAEACRRALEQRPQLRLIIAYTKADEYGVMDEEAIRLISSAMHGEALRRYRVERPESAWNQFVTSTVSEAASVRREGMAAFSHNTRSGTGAEWSDTRAWVLRQTRSLWDFALQWQPSPLLNAYFVAPASRDSYLDEARSGVMHMLADMVQLSRPGTASAVSRDWPGATPRGPKQPAGRREL
jgi:hypothetical protein